MSTFVDPCNVLKVFLEVITTFTVQRVKIWIKKESKKNSFHDNSLSAWHGQPRMKHRTSHRQQFWVVTLTEFSNMANDRYYFHQTLFHTIIFYGLTNISSKSLVESKDLKWRCRWSIYQKSCMTQKRKNLATIRELQEFCFSFRCISIEAEPDTSSLTIT